MARTAQVIELPSVSPGTRRELILRRWGREGARPKVYVQAALHAEEWPGLLMAHHLTRLLDQAEREGRIAGEVVLLPYANPIGLNQSVNGHLIGRHHLADEGGNFSNFNRDWPDLTAVVAEKLEGRLGEDPEVNVALVRAALLEAVSELPEATEKDVHRKTLLGLSVDADCVFDLHCCEEGLLHVYANEHHQDSLLELGRDLGAPLFLIETGAAGCFDEANAAPWSGLRDRLGLGDGLPLACFAATLELRGVRDVCDEICGSDAENLLRFLTRRGVLARDPGPLPEAQGEPLPLYGSDLVKAPAAGIVVWKKKVGDHVRAGETLAELVDIAAGDPTRARSEIRAASDGLLYSILDDRLVRPGVTLGRIAGRETLSHRSRAPQA